MQQHTYQGGTSDVELSRSLIYCKEAESLVRKQEKKISDLRIEYLIQKTKSGKLEGQLLLAQTRVSVLQRENESLKEMLSENRSDNNQEAGDALNEYRSQDEQPPLRSTVHSDSSDNDSDSCGSSDRSESSSSSSSSALIDGRENRMYELRRRAGDVIEHKITQTLIFVMIIINCIMLGVGTYDFVSKDPPTQRLFDTTYQFFLCIYTVELLLHLTHKRLSMFNNGWLTFDFCVVLGSWVSELIGGLETSIVRGLRVFRMLQLIPRIKIMRGIVSALVSTLPRMASTFVLLLLVFYIFAVMFTSQYSYMSQEYPLLESAGFFDRLDHTMFTLFQVMTLDELDLIARDLTSVSSNSWITLLIFVLITDALFLNVLIAIMCGAIPTMNAAINDEKVSVHPLHSQLKRRLAHYEKLTTVIEAINEQNQQQERTKLLVKELNVLVKQMQRRHSVFDMKEKLQDIDLGS